MLWSFQDSAFKTVLVGYGANSSLVQVQISKIKSLNRIELLYPGKVGSFWLELRWNKHEADRKGKKNRQTER